MNGVAFDWYAWVGLPLIIFVARIFDVTLGTVRIILVSRGRRKLAPILGFFEVLIWIVVVGQLVQNLQSVTSYLGYAAGFAAGNFVGMLLEDKIALGSVIVRTIVAQHGVELAQELHDQGYGVTSVEGVGANGPVCLVYTTVRRKDLPSVMAIIHRICPKAFCTVEDVRSTEAGIFPKRSRQDLRPDSSLK